MLEETRVGAVAVLSLNRPPANALDLDLTTALVHRLEGLAADQSAAAVVLTGLGECFCAGLDLKTVPLYDPNEQRTMVAMVNRLLYRLYGFPKPTVVAVNGHAVAAGTLITLACDSRIAPEDNCKFGLTGLRVDIPYPVCALALATAVITPPYADELILSARTISSHDALRRGIVHDLLPRSQVLNRAMEIATDMAGLPQPAYHSHKQMMRAHALATMANAVNDENDPTLARWICRESN